MDKYIVNYGDKYYLVKLNKDNAYDLHDTILSDTIPDKLLEISNKLTNQEGYTLKDAFEDFAKHRNYQTILDVLRS